MHLLISSCRDVWCLFDFLPTLSDARTQGHRQTQSILLLLCLSEAVIPSDTTGDAPAT